MILPEQPVNDTDNRRENDPPPGFCIDNRSIQKMTKTKKRIQTVAALLVLALLVSSAVYYKYDSLRSGWQAADAQETVTLKIAYLPITHALPLFEAKKLLEEENSNVQVELVKYGGWSELMDALNTSRVDGASVLIEMAMKSREQGIPLKLAMLGHRDGNVVITSKNISKPAQLKGKTFAIPNTQSSHNILRLQTLLEKNGMSADDVKILEMAPTEMPAALQSGQIDGYCVAEPFGAKAVDAGIGQVFATSEELWGDSSMLRHRAKRRCSQRQGIRHRDFP